MSRRQALSWFALGVVIGLALAVALVLHAAG